MTDSHCYPGQNPYGCPRNPACCVCRGIHCFMAHPGHSHDGIFSGDPLSVLLDTIKREQMELVVLPAIAGHAHTLGTDGQPTCGCVPFAQTFTLPIEKFIAQTHKAHCRVEHPPHRCSCKPVFSSNLDVGADIPGGGAA